MVITCECKQHCNDIKYALVMDGYRECGYLESDSWKKYPMIWIFEDSAFCVSRTGDNKEILSSKYLSI